VESKSSAIVLKANISAPVLLGLSLACAHGSQQAGPVNPHGADPIENGTFEQRLDPAQTSDARTFRQRYVVDSRYAHGPSAPVLYFICGEASCDAEELFSPTKMSIAAIAEALHARMVGLEHRYFGQSQPFETLDAESLRFLSVDNAVEDLRGFEQWMRGTRHPEWTGRWFAVGVSYSANLAATYRERYPDMVDAALASGLGRFDQGTTEVDRAAARTAGPDCVARYRKKVLGPAKAALDHPELMKPLKALFEGQGIPDDLDFFGALTGVGLLIIQVDGPKALCEAVTSDEPLPAVAKVFRDAMSQLHFSLQRLSYAGMADPRASSYREGFGTRQWMYLTCKEFGLYDSLIPKANPDAEESVLDTVTDPLPLAYCARYFGISTPPDMEAMNRKYYKPLLDPHTSRILFMNGSDDPACFPLSISHENGNDTNPNTTAYTLKGGAHCEDLTRPPTRENSPHAQAVRDARAFEIKTLSQWMGINSGAN
jgi:pimeloyl-ACP methyl ester carboxylesterase